MKRPPGFSSLKLLIFEALFFLAGTFREGDARASQIEAQERPHLFYPWKASTRVKARCVDERDRRSPCVRLCESLSNTHTLAQVHTECVLALPPGVELELTTQQVYAAYANATLLRTVAWEAYNPNFLDPSFALDFGGQADLSNHPTSGADYGEGDYGGDGGVGGRDEELISIVGGRTEVILHGRNVTEKIYPDSKFTMRLHLQTSAEVPTDLFGNVSPAFTPRQHKYPRTVFADNPGAQKLDTRRTKIFQNGFDFHHRAGDASDASERTALPESQYYVSLTDMLTAGGASPEFPKFVSFQGPRLYDYELLVLDNNLGEPLFDLTVEKSFRVRTTFLCSAYDSCESCNQASGCSWCLVLRGSPYTCSSTCQPLWSLPECALLPIPPSTSNITQ